MRLAIVGGIAQYQHQAVLDACKNDAETLKKFLDAAKIYSDICFLGHNTTGTESKKIISEFVQKHSSNQVDELFFYFSGHGDRTEDDFFYAMSDYRSDRRETTGLRNSELDSLIRNLSPKLTIKIVDACYSGSAYIKSEGDITPAIKKSAKENQLNDLYFFYSSPANQPSLAGPKFSFFTLALFQALSDQHGPVRYRDLMAAVADEMNGKGAPEPTFVVQARSLEIFVEMDKSLSDLLKSEIALPLQTPSGTGIQISEGEESDTTLSQAITNSPQALSLAELAAVKAEKIYCTKEEAKASIQLMDALFLSSNYPQEIRDAYDIDSAILDEDDVPNKLAIAKWINSLKDDSVFAIVVSETQTYIVEEYKELPRKPTRDLFGFSALTQVHRILGEDKDYRLESVTKQRQVISGFKYTVDPVFSPCLIRFCPKLSSLEEYAACIVCLFSRRSLTCLYSIEHLPYTGWDETQPVKANQWKQLTVLLKDQKSIQNLVQSVISEISEYVRADARQRLS